VCFNICAFCIANGQTKNCGPNGSRYSVIAVKLVTLTEMCLDKCLSHTVNFQWLWINEFAALIFSVTLTIIVFLCVVCKYRTLVGMFDAVNISTGWQIV
jgi:hypothetical protein